MGPLTFGTDWAVALPQKGVAMPEFLEAAACRGRRPERVAAQRRFFRPDLIAKLLRERHVARFLVAPDGFGKSSLACEYADTVFSFEHVFWINGKSPCFLRDLDRGDIAARLRGLDSAPFLAVFEDVPRLDAERAACFSHAVDDLLDAGEEVLATCVPTSDAYARSHRDRTKLDAAGLLLTEAECALAPAGAGADRGFRAEAPAERVACLWWGSDDGTQLLAGVGREELPGDAALALVAMLALQEGGWSDLEAFLPAGMGKDLIDLLEGGYPFLGIDRHAERYRAARFPMRAVAAAFDGSFDVLAARSLFDGRDALACRLADALVARAEGGRACDLMETVASKAACASWLSRHRRTLLEGACLKPAHDLCAFAGRTRGAERLSLGVAEAWRLAALGDGERACAIAQRVAFADAAPADDRAFALAVVMACGGADARLRARRTAKGLLQAREASLRAARGGAEEHAGAEGAGASDNAAFWAPLLAVMVALGAGLPAAADAWLAAREGGADEGALSMGAALLFNAAAGGGDAGGKNAREGGAGACEAALGEAARFVRERLGAATEAEAPLGFFAAAAARALDRAAAQGALQGAPALPPAGARAARQVEASVLEQRAAYRKEAQEHRRRREDYCTTHLNAFRDDRRSRGGPAPSLAGAPLLRVNLFGGFEAWVGDEPVDPQRLRRQKARTLLALLVLNRGKEITRDRLAQALWPDSKLESARKNLYSIWSQLRRALATPDGACPYLVRSQSGCRLDARLVDSDVARFEALCRSLLFSGAPTEAWESMFAQVSDGFSDDLLPGESACELIVHTRDEYRVRLVDALVAASARLVEAGEVRGGLWFAREALKRDASREDAYTALMEAQIAAGQRTAALETYFACRQYLANELGIDPSVRTVQLYRDIIEAEEALEW